MRILVGPSTLWLSASMQAIDIFALLHDIGDMRNIYSTLHLVNYQKAHFLMIRTESGYVSTIWQVLTGIRKKRSFHSLQPIDHFKEL